MSECSPVWVLYKGDEEEEKEEYDTLCEPDHALVFKPGSLLSKTCHSSAWSDPFTRLQFHPDDKYITEASPAHLCEALKLHLLPTMTKMCNFALSYWVG